MNATAAPYAPWYVIPADKKWFSRLLISEVIVHHLIKLDPQYPTVGEDQKKSLREIRRQLAGDEKA